jgi:hypothetical protein
MVYEQAIREDKAMTAAIQRRELTRAERRRKLDDLFDSLRATEVLNTPTSKPGKTGGDRLSPQEIETFSQMFLPDRFGH